MKGVDDDDDDNVSISKVSGQYDDAAIPVSSYFSNDHL